MTTGPLLKVPQHVALLWMVMAGGHDSNLFSRLEGHKRGSEVAREIVTTAARIGVSYLPYMPSPQKLEA